MCLSKVSATYLATSELIVDGWKSFAGPSTAPLFENFALPGQKLDKAVPLDQWIQASDANAPKGIRADDGRNYMPGFHVYSDEAEVKKNRANCRRVYIRRVTSEGNQDAMKCVIAQEMYVPSDPDAWPPLPEPPAPPKPSVGSVPAPKKKLIDRIKKAAGGKS